MQRSSQADDHRMTRGPARTRSRLEDAFHRLECTLNV
jgi:hypothetical protein